MKATHLVLAAALGCLIPTSLVLAQQAPQTPNEQALLSEITAQTNAKLQCLAAWITRGQELEKATARIKELEALIPKAPDKDAPAKP